MASPTDGTHYFDAEPGAASASRTVELALPDLRLTLASDRGVFAADHLDPGTKLLLLEGPEPVPGDHHLLDLGAGYGPIALTLAHRNPTAVVWAVEVNARARDLCRANAETAGLANVRVVAPDEVPADLVVDRIWSNPPIRVGKAALHDLLAGHLARLARAGSAHLVVQKHLGADSLQRWLTERGWATSRRASRRGYRLLDVAARPPEPDR
jgi:16S rRNA (guanine1207-N2)-methyltransferase